MVKNKNESAILRYDILVLKRIGVTRDLPSGTESLQWVTNTATLIYGEHDAVVVDTFATINQNQQLVDWITKSGKNLTTIYITMRMAIIHLVSRYYWIVFQMQEQLQRQL